MPRTPIRLPAPAPFALWQVSLAGEDTDDDGLLDDVERARAARFAFERDRQRFVAAHVVLRRLLGEHTGCAPASLVIETGEFGKPRLRDQPHCSFSLSHCADQALVAVADGQEIGVDLEALRPLADLDALARQCLGPGERRQLEATPQAGRELAFLRAWTRKEACLKALGTGLHVEPASFETGLAAGAAQVRIETPQGARVVHVHSLAPMPGWIAALAHCSPKRGDVVA